MVELLPLRVDAPPVAPVPLVVDVSGRQAPSCLTAASPVKRGRCLHVAGTWGLYFGYGRSALENQGFGEETRGAHVFDVQATVVAAVAGAAERLQAILSYSAVWLVMLNRGATGSSKSGDAGDAMAE